MDKPTFRGVTNANAVIATVTLKTGATLGLIYEQRRSPLRIPDIGTPRCPVRSVVSVRIRDL